MWCWEELREQLGAELNLNAFDNRGAGRSDKPAGPYTIAQLADDAAGVLDGLGLARVAVLGHSMGGYIAQELALRHPSRVRSLVLVGTASGGPATLPVPKTTLDIWLANAHLPPPEYVRATMHLSFAPGWTDDHPSEYEAFIEARLEYPTPPEAWRAQFDAANAWSAAARPVEEIRVPTLVIHGDADRVLPVENGREIARRIPGAELRELPGRGHVLNLEEPDEFNGIVLDFLS